MKRRSVWATLLCLAVIAALAVVAAPAQAVIGGQHDDTGVYPNVGVVLEQDSSGGGVIGSCTLVSDRVVVTAMHMCVDSYDMANPTYISPGMRIRVSFDPNADPFDPENGARWYEADRVDVPPTTLPPADASNPSIKAWLAPGREDVGVVRLAEPVIGTTPATVVDGDGLSAIDLKAASFTIVGWGITGIYRGSLLSWNNPNLRITVDGRNYRDGIRVISEDWVYADRFLMVSAGSAPGDSGGPLFYGTTVVAETTRGNGYTADTPSYYYRLDTPASQTLLHKWLPAAESFVTLP